MRDEDIHSDDKEEKRRYRFYLARLKKKRRSPGEQGLEKYTINIQYPEQARGRVFEDSSGSENDTLDKNTVEKEESIKGEKKTLPQKELDIAIARKDYKEYIKKNVVSNNSNNLEIFPITREEGRKIPERPVKRKKIQVIKKKKPKEVKQSIQHIKKVPRQKPVSQQKSTSVKRKKQPIPIVRHEKKHSETVQKSKPVKRSGKFKKIFGTVFLLALLLGFSYFAYGFLYKQSGYYTIAIFGVDSREGNTEAGALADVDIICNINRETKEIQLISIYRDTYSMIDASGKYHKLNEAYFLGGHKQAVETLERMLDMKIDDYITFNWKSVVDAINILGGVDVEITESEFEYINSFITETVESTGIGSYQLAYPGEHHLDGVQAVAYARLRLMDTDFNRTERQRKIADLALDKAKRSDFNTLKNLVLSVYPEISSSISVDDLLPFIKDAEDYRLIESLGFPFDKDTKDIGKLNYVIPVTLESNVRKLHEILYKDKVYEPSRELIDISNTIKEKSGLATKEVPEKEKTTDSNAN